MWRGSGGAGGGGVVESICKKVRVGREKCGSELEWPGRRGEDYWVQDGEHSGRVNGGKGEGANTKKRDRRPGKEEMQYCGGIAIRLGECGNKWMTVKRCV